MAEYSTYIYEGGEGGFEFDIDEQEGHTDYYGGRYDEASGLAIEYLIQEAESVGLLGTALSAVHITGTDSS
jgi:hypothetical protein